MIKGTLPNDCLVCSVAYKTWISKMGLLLWMWHNRAKCLFIIYLSVSLFAHDIVRTYQVHVFKKKNITWRSSGRQNAFKAFCLPQDLHVMFVFFTCFFFFFFFCFLLLLLFIAKFPMHMHMLIWNFGGHMSSWTPSLVSCMSFFYC